MPDAVQVSQAFLADVAADDQIAFELHSAALDDPDEGEYLGELGGVIADAGAVIAVSFLSDGKGSVHGEDGIDVGGHVDGGTVSCALDQRINIVDLVHGHVQAFGPHHLGEALCPLLLVAGEGRDQHQLLMLLPGMGFVCFHDLKAFFDDLGCHQGLISLVHVILLSARGLSAPFAFLLCQLGEQGIRQALYAQKSCDEYEELVYSLLEAGGIELFGQAVSSGAGAAASQGDSRYSQRDGDVGIGGGRGDVARLVSEELVVGGACLYQGKVHGLGACGPVSDLDDLQAHGPVGVGQLAGAGLVGALLVPVSFGRPAGVLLFDSGPDAGHDLFVGLVQAFL